MFLVERGVYLFIYIGCRKTKGIISWDSLCKSSFALGPMHNTDIQKMGIGHIYNHFFFGQLFIFGNFMA